MDLLRWPSVLYLSRQIVVCDLFYGIMYIGFALDAYVMVLSSVSRGREQLSLSVTMVTHRARSCREPR